MSRQVKIAVAVVVVVLLLAIGGMLWFRGAANRAAPQSRPAELAAASASVPSPTAAPSPVPAPSPAPVEPIKVGLILSHEMSIMSLLADGQTEQKTPAPWGYKHMTVITRELKSRSIQLIPVIEPGTETDPLLAEMLARQFRGVAPINGHDAGQLGTLNVLVAAQVWAATPEMIAATDEAVSNGLGLLIRQAFGDWRPGFTPQVLRLHGLKEGAYARTTPWNKFVPAEIIGEHPILGTLSGKQSTELADVLPTGAYGVLSDGAMPLVRLKFLERIVPQRLIESHPDWSFYTLYTARLGRGRIICCNFDVANQPAKDLQRAAGGAFTLHCLEWLAAGQEASAATQPATPLPADKALEGL